MTNEESKELRTALRLILANVSQLQMQVEAAIAVLKKSYPDIHAEFERALAEERTKTTNASALLLERLDRTLLRNNS